MSKRLVLCLFILAGSLTAGCRASEPQTVTELVEVTRVVEVTTEPETGTEFVEVTRIVEVEAEAPAEETLSILPHISIDVRTYPATNGRDYVVYVALPMSYPATDFSYPVMYITDGDWYTIPTAMSAAQLAFGEEMPEVIVVGVGYGGSIMDAFGRRDEDMSAEGSANFLQFIEETLIPDIEANFRAAPTPRALIGHSAGGNFSLYAMLNAPETFNYIVSSSPSCADTCMTLEQDYASANDALPVRLFLSAGELDDALDFTTAFWAALQASEYDGLVGEMLVLDGETHLSARPRALTTGMKWIFAGGE